MHPIIFFSIIGFVFGVYLVFLLLLFFFQAKLIFQNVKPNFLAYKELESKALELMVGNGTRLHGWHLSGKVSNEGKPKAVVYFGGNAQDVNSVLPMLESLKVNDVYTFNYRGYGLSEGESSEGVLYADALEIFDYVARCHEGAEMIIIGHSLGSAVAGYTVKHRRQARLVLSCPLHSITRIAWSRFYAPSLVIRHKFELVATAKNIHSETLVLVAENDLIIPLEHSELSYKNLSTENQSANSSSHNNVSPKKRIKKIKNCGHNDLLRSDEAVSQVNEFICNSNTQLAS